MVSTKKARGKARKAAKAKKEDDDDNDSSTATAAAQQREQEGPLELQMQRLSIDTRSHFCMHGFVPFPEGHVCDRFLRFYLGTCDAGTPSDPATAVLTAMRAVEDKYPEVLRDSSKMKQILSYFSSEGTQCILDGDKETARTTAARIILVEEFIAIKVLKTQAVVLHIQKVMEILIADDHTLVSFFRKRITCSCLDKKHKEVKSIKKMGFCNNDQCPLGGKVERSKMLYCTRCSDQYYCSRDCQKAHWSKHREECKEWAEENARFERIRNHNAV